MVFSSSGSSTLIDIRSVDLIDRVTSFALKKLFFLIQFYLGLQKGHFNSNFHDNNFNEWNHLL